MKGDTLGAPGGQVSAFTGAGSAPPGSMCGCFAGGCRPGRAGSSSARSCHCGLKWALVPDGHCAWSALEVENPRAPRSLVVLASLQLSVVLRGFFHRFAFALC